MTTPQLKRFKLPRWLQVVLYLVVFAILLNSLLSGWEQVREFEWTFNPWLLLLAMAVHITYFICHSLLWIWMVRRLNVALTYRVGLHIYMSSWLAKHLPGGFWPFATVITRSRQENLPSSALVLPFAISMLLAVWVSALFALPVIPLALPEMANLGLIIVGLLVCCVLATPWVLRWGLQLVLRWRRLALPVAENRMTGLRALALVFAVFVLLHALDSVSVFLFISSTTPLSLIDGLYATLAWSGAWVIGFLVLVLPSGLGVREVSLTLLLQPVMPMAVATVIAVGHRVFVVIFNLLVLLALSLATLRQRLAARATGRAAVLPAGQRSDQTEIDAL